MYSDEIMSRLRYFKLQLQTLDIEIKEPASNLHRVHSFCLKHLLVTTKGSADCLAKHNVLKCKISNLRNQNVVFSYKKINFFQADFSLYVFFMKLHLTRIFLASDGH